MCFSNGARPLLLPGARFKQTLSREQCSAASQPGTLSSPAGAWSGRVLGSSTAPQVHGIRAKPPLALSPRPSSETEPPAETGMTPLPQLGLRAPSAMGVSVLRDGGDLGKGGTCGQWYFWE